MLKDIPQGIDFDSWEFLATKCLEDALLADKASVAWERRSDAEHISEGLRSIGKEWISLASGVPIREAWARGSGAEFSAAVRQLIDHPSFDTIVTMRSALYSGALTQLTECWQVALDQQEEITKLKANLSSIQKSSDRIAEWWDERPEGTFVLSVRTEDWPECSRA